MKNTFEFIEGNKKLINKKDDKKKQKKQKEIGTFYLFFLIGYVLQYA